ncbi:MAG: histidine--tRNA ligase [Candidatus Peregrinibacteria bacterium]|nr:histidine--tRNA ligase [Candidatus Peregrinibacteria bacterium]
MSDESSEAPVVKKVQTPSGVFDIIPDEQLYYTYIKKVVRHRCRQSGFRRITTPIFEFKDIFERSIGETTNLVQNELFSLENSQSQKFVLKPEGTVGIARAYVQHNMEELPQPVELYYIEPHFRAGSTRKGSFRQFWQFGFEVLGESDPALDAQVIQLGHKILEDLGIAHLFTIQVNSIGCGICREKYITDLENYYIGKERSMCKNCVDTLNHNPLRLLDCKEEDCEILAHLAPKLKLYLCKECKAFHEKCLEYLNEMDLKYVENENLVRGLDYYSRTVFEFWDPKQGSSVAVGSGGRYDKLVESLGGPPTPGVGAAFGMERIIHHMKREKIDVPSKDDLHIFVAQLGDEAKKKCLNLIWELRERGVKTVGALGKGSVKGQLQLATKFGVPYTLILGITEVREGTIIVRNMAKGQQRSIAFDEVVDEVVKLIGEKNLDKYTPGEIIYS